MFDIVADVERYPEFVPGYRTVRVLRREPELVEAEQVVALAGMELRFRSRADLDRPRLIRVRSSDGPFQALQVDWQFSPTKARACRIDVHTAYTLAPGLLTPLVLPVVDEMIAAGLNAFVQRARNLYAGSSLR